MEHTITLTTEEAQQLTGLLDIATQAQGLRAAQSALYFANKIGTVVNKDLEQADKEKVPVLGEVDNE